MLTPPWTDQELQQIAYDISEALTEGEWPQIDVCAADILPFLPEFLRTITSYSKAVTMLGGHGTPTVNPRERTT